jgi:TRAP transporter TAXI family solute receptor
VATTDPPAGSARVRSWRQWWTRDVLVVAVPVVAIVALTFYVAARFVQPAPPDRLVMATGAVGGAYQTYGEQYRDRLGKYGVTLELRQTNGAAENFALLRDGRVDVALVQGGVGQPLPDVNGEPPVVSLGALYYEPMWVFQSVNRPPVDTLTALSGSRVAIGAEGSGTRALALQLLRSSGIDSKSTLLLPLGGGELTAALDAGEVDVVFQVGGIEAPIIGDLLRRRDFRLMSLAQAAAYARRNAHLRVLTVPRGVVDLVADLPARDITTVATTANLLAQNAVHPALVYLLLDTVSEINSGHAQLAEAGTFPNARGQEMPVANEARRYYRSGKPFLKNYLPYWAANFVDRMLILLIPIVGVLIPAIKLAPALYTYRLKSRIGGWYARLSEVESEIAGRQDPAKIDACIARLDAIEAEIGATQLPNWLSEQVYLLRAAIDLVRERLGIPGAKAHPRLRAQHRGGAGLGTPDRPA